MAQITSGSHRLSILSAEDIEDIYGLPRFTDEDRHLFFGLSPPEREAVNAHTPSVAAQLILQLGYFKAKRQFFNYSLENAANDLHHIQGQYFPGMSVASMKMLSRPTQSFQHQVILKLFGYHNCDSAAKDELERKAQRVAMLSTQPLYILRESLKYLENQRIVAPTYTFLQDMVGKVVTHERNRITQLLSHALTPLLKTQLDTLLTADEQVYRINALKREPKDFGYNELRREVGRRKFFQPLYEFARSFLAEAGLSNESGKYYASLVKFYTVYKKRVLFL